MFGVKRAKKDEPYETITLNSWRKAQKMIAQGWEVVSDSGSSSAFWGNSLKIILRRPNPRYQGAKK